MLHRSVLALAVCALLGFPAANAAWTGHEPWLELRSASPLHQDVGAPAFIGAPGSGAARPRAMASADLDGDGTPDLVTGYALGDGGVITVRRGNREAFAPGDDSVYARIQQGFDPEPFEETAESYALPEPADLLVTGEFTRAGGRDVIAAARNGGLYLFAGGSGKSVGAATRIELPGRVVALSAGEFGAPDGWTDLAVGIVGPDGPALLIFDGRAGFTAAPRRIPLPEVPTAVEFGALDADPFLDVAVAAGSEILIVHGSWRGSVTGRHLERVSLPFAVQGLATGFFVWNREGRAQLAALAADGRVRILHRGPIDERPFTDLELTQRARSRLTQKRGATALDSVSSWPESGAEGWTAVRELPKRNGAAARSLYRTHLSPRQTDELVVTDRVEAALAVLRQRAEGEAPPARATLAGDLIQMSLEGDGAPLDLVTLPQRPNGERTVVVLYGGGPLVRKALASTITVDRFDDPSGGSLAAASACTAAANDCSLRGAVEFANLPANAGSTLMLPAGTYVLNTPGSGGCVVEPSATGNTIGDLEVNQTTTFMGAGAASTIVRQGAATNDRVLCMDVPLAPGLTFTFSGLTFTGGRDVNSGVGGGGFIGGARSTTLNLTNVTFANNQSTGPNVSGGGGVAVTGGDMNVTNCTFGAANLPGANRNDLTLGNAVNSNSGGGLSYSPGDPLGVGGATGTLTVTGTTFTHNTSSSGSAGGGGIDVFNFNTSTGTANISTSTFTFNQATGTASGGGINNESFVVNVSTTSFTSNSAGNRGGGIYVGGGLGTMLNGASLPGVTMSGNSAPSGGSSISTAGILNVSGTNVTLGGDIEITTNAVWTNLMGSALSPTDVRITGGTFNCNDSTMNIAGNFILEPQSAMGVGGTFNGGTGTVNIGGNVTLTAGGAAMTPTVFNAGPTFNFNGSGAQSIGGTLSPTFNNFIVNKSMGSTLTLGIDTPVASNLTVTAGVLDLGSHLANRTAAGGTLTVANGATLKIGGTNSIPTNYSTHAFGTTSTIEYESGSAQTLSPESYGHLTSSGGGARTLNSGQTMSIAGNFTAGASTYTLTGSTVIFNGSVPQTIPALNYNNLTSSSTGARTLASSGTIGVAGAFTPGTNAYTVAGSTVDFNGSSGSSTIPAFNFDNLTSSNMGTRVLAPSGTIGIAGVFTPGMNAYTTTGSTVNFNGGVAQAIPALAYNNLTSSNSGNRTLASSGTIGIAGVFTPGANAYSVSGSTVNFNGTGAQTVPVLDYNNLTISGARTTNSVTLASGGTIGVFGAFSPTASFTTGAYLTGGSTLDFKGGGAQTIPAFPFDNLTSSSSGARTLASSGTIGVTSVFTPGANTYTITGSTVSFNGAVPQTIPAFAYNNLTSTSTGARTIPSSGTVKIAGAFTPGTNAYTITGSTVEYNGAAPQTLPSGFTTYNNLTLNNAAGTTGFPGLVVQALADVKAGTFTTGGTLNDGLVETGATLAVPAAGTLAVNGTLTLSGANVTATGTLSLAGSLTSSAAAGSSVISGAGAVSLPAGSHTVTVADGAAAIDVDVTAAVNGTGGLTKAGAGVLRLSGANGYTGSTAVNAGTLLVNGAQAGSAVSVTAGTLGGSGTTGTLTGAGGAVRPGQSPGILSCGNLALSGATTFGVELNGTMVGTQYDQLNVTGTVSLGGSLLSPTVGFVPSTGQTFTIVSNDSTDPVTGTFATLAEGATFAVGTNAFQITYAGGANANDVVLTSIPCTAPSASTPATQTVCPNSTAILTTTATGVGPLTYQWKNGVTNLVDGGNISGATTATLTINPATAADNGSYTCVVSGGCAPPFTTGAATLTVADTTVPVVTAPASATVTQTVCQ